MNSSTRQTVIVAVCGFLAVVVAGGGFLLVLQPQRSKLSATNAKITAAQAQFAALHQSPAKAPSIPASDLFSLSRAMPEIDDIPGVVVDLAQLAKANRLQLVSVRPAPRVQLPSGSSAVPITVTLNGNWKDLSAFLKAVRLRVTLAGDRPVVGGRVYNVDNIQIQTGTEHYELEAVLAMDAFDYGAPPSPTATAGVTGAGGTTTTGATTTTSAGGTPAAPTPGSGS